MKGKKLSPGKGDEAELSQHSPYMSGGKVPLDAVDLESSQGIQYTCMGYHVRITGGKWVGHWLAICSQGHLS